MSAAAIADEVEATPQQKMKRYGEQAQVSAASSESPLPPATPDSKPQCPPPTAPETLTSSAVAAGSRKKQEVAAASTLNEEKKKRKRSTHEEAVATPSPSVASASQILEVAAEGAMARKEWSLTIKRCRNGKPRVLSDRELLRTRILELRKQQQLLQGFVPVVANPNSIDQDPKNFSSLDAFFDQFRYKPDRPQGHNARSLPKTPDCPARPPPRDHSSCLYSPLTANATSIVAKSTTSETQLRKQQLHLPQGFVPAVANPNSIDQDPKTSPPLDAFFDQFRYKPDRLQGHNARSLPKTPDCPARPPPRDHLSCLSSPLTANVTSIAAKSTTSETQLRKQQQHLPQGFVPAVANPNSIDQDPKNSLPLVGFFDQFRYEPVHRQGHNARSLPKTSDRPARPPPRDHSSCLSSLLTANATFIAAKSTTSETQLRKQQQQLPQGFVHAVANPNSIDQDPQNSSPFDAFFDQFRYKPNRWQGHNAPSLPKTPDRPARPPPRDHPSSLSSPLTANATFMAAKSMTLKIQSRKQQQLLHGFVPAVANPNSNDLDQDPKYSSSFDAFFDQFRYRPDHPQGHDAPSLPKTPYRSARPPPRDHPSSLSSPLTANATFKAAKSTTLNTKQPSSQGEVKVKPKIKPEKKMSRMKKPRKPAALLSKAEKKTDKYLRVPLNQLVSPPRFPYKLLQEKYASDPWKVIIICMLLNLTQGKQVRKKVKGFFRRYPDPQTAYTADPTKMALYLKPLGFQHVKTKRIQKFSKSYVETEWKYITDLCGVGKYAADAYAIFCAGKADKVVPKDHKLVDYWKYVCYVLPLIKASPKNAQKASGVTVQGNCVPDVQQISMGC